MAEHWSVGKQVAGRSERVAETGKIGVFCRGHQQVGSSCERTLNWRVNHPEISTAPPVSLCVCVCLMLVFVHDVHLICNDFILSLKWLIGS